MSARRHTVGVVYAGSASVNNYFYYDNFTCKCLRSFLIISAYLRLILSFLIEVALVDFDCPNGVALFVLYFTSKRAYNIHVFYNFLRPISGNDTCSIKKELPITGCNYVYL